MDALPMNDEKHVDYASRVPGCMHACGHDAHMAMAYGVAIVMMKAWQRFPGKIRFIFQPSEEAAPSGAEEMVKENVMDGVDSIFAFHVDPEIEVGRIGLRSGMLTATCNEFHMTLLGKSGHGARPHQSIDTIYIANQVLTALYDVVNHRSQAYTPAVLSVGQIHGGAKANVIPEKVRISGTLRTVDPKSSTEIFDAIEERVSAITRASGGHFQIEFTQSIPGVYNDRGLIEEIRDIFTELYGSEKIVAIPNVSMGGEDFSWYLNKAPGALIRLGSRTPGDAVHYLHTNDFDIDERSLSLGVEVMCNVVSAALNETQ
jgi:amidohydrolase